MYTKFYLFLLLIATLVTVQTAKAQVKQAPPDGIIFQAIATDPQGNPAAGRTIYVQDRILQNTASGSVVYSETFQVTSSATGVFTIVIGKGSVTYGPSSIGSIDWSAGPYFLNIKSDVGPVVPISGWTPTYTDMGTSQFLSVPYALNAGNIAGLNLPTTGTQTAGTYLRSNGTNAALTTIQAADVPTLNQNTTGSAAKLTSPKTIAITGDLAYTSPAFDGSGNVTAAGTLATVNSNVGTFGSTTTIPSVTVNSKGLVTAVSDNAVAFQAPLTLTTAGSGTASLIGNTLNIPTASTFTLSKASASTLGGIIVGNNLSIDQNGVLSATSTGLLKSYDDWPFISASNLYKYSGYIISTQHTGMPSFPEDLPDGFTCTLSNYSGATFVSNALTNTKFYSSQSGASGASTFSITPGGSVNLYVTTTSGRKSYFITSAATGPQGAQGPQGVQGPQGPQGSSAANVLTGIVAPVNGGTGVATLTGLVMGNGTNAMTAAVAGTDYVVPSGDITGTATTATNIAGGTGGTIPYQSAAGTTAMLANGTSGYVLTAQGTTLAPVWAAPLSMGTIAGSSNANGGTITSGVLKLTPADATNGGVVTNGSQTITGAKTFDSGLTVTNKPFLPPVLTQSQVNAISAPTEGMVVYNITQRKLQLYSVGQTNIINDVFSGTYTNRADVIKQTFVVPATGAITQIQLYAQSPNGFPICGLNININGTSTAGGFFTNLTTSPQWLTITFGTPAQVVAGQSMYFTTNGIELAMGDCVLGTNSAYGNGSVVSQSGGSINGNDLMFRILITPSNGTAYWVSLN